MSLLILNLFISEYLDKVLPWKEMKLAFLVKLQTENLFFCFRIKIKTRAAQTRNIIQSSSTFIRISGPVLEVKKSSLINDYENIIGYSEESKQNEVLMNKCGLFPIHLVGLRISVTSGKFGYFYSL